MLLKKIVVAEDDDAIAHMVNMALGDAGFLCLRARDGEEAIRLVRMHSPDVLVLDVMMPAVDGMEVVKRLRADVMTSRIPILMLTALADIDHRVEGLDAGADDYVTKPFDLRELAARVNALIRASKRERERNPTTDLPGSVAIEHHVARLFSEGAVASVLHLDVVGFDEYADRVGYQQAEDLVAHLGKLVLETAQTLTSGGVFIGHLGGVDFIVTSEPDETEDIADALVAAFDEALPEWTNDEAASALRLAGAVVPLHDVHGTAELAARLGATLRASKQRDGSNYLVWQPREPA
jgi:DNA-binding response OmpR family regulator